jgi:DNA repair photolyase
MEQPSVDARHWPPAPYGVEYHPLRVSGVLRQNADPNGPWHWALNPYVGCELGCTYCPARLDEKELSRWVAFERRIGVKVNLVEAFLHELRAPDFERRQIVLGTETEPWQPAEEKLKLTRALLSAMAEVDGIDLRINTRSSLIARDTDLLLKIRARGHVTVSFSMASIDDRIGRLLEPKAPSAMRRLAAMEALARAGVPVGISVAPVLAGLDERELGLETLLVRAANAGARFAGMTVMHFGPGQRESFLAHVTAVYPEYASRFRRVIGRRGHTDEECKRLAAQFDALCTQLGLTRLADAVAPRALGRRDTPSQIPLFSPELVP